MDTSAIKKRTKSDRPREQSYQYNKVKIKFDKRMLDSLIGYIFVESKFITKSNLTNLQKLLTIVDTRIYETDSLLYGRLEFLRKALEGRLSKGLIRRDLLISFCQKENNEENAEIISRIDEYTKITYDEIMYINKAIIDRLKYAFIVFYKDIIYDKFLRIDQGDYQSFEEVTTSIKETISYLMNDIRKVENVASLTTFSLDDGVFEAFIEETVKNASDSNMALMTGIRALNDILSPGYLPGRLYLWLGITGGFKSAMLLHSCRWIKLFNQVTPRRKDPGCTPVVLYITTENSVEESIVRLFNLSVSQEDIKNFSAEEVIDMMREKGGYTLKNGETNIIMKYYGNLEIDTNDLYTIIDEIEEDNNEVIALVFDYIKRIRSAEPTNDEIMRLKYASNEMKDLAIRLKIPVITAQQINRAGNMTIDSALESGKEDLGRFLGRGNIAQAWDLLENSDWVGVLNVERERSTDKRYLTIKELKKRYKSHTEITYINHPFVEGSTIMLVDDVNLDKSVSKLSLASDLVGVSEADQSSRGSKTAKERKKVDSAFSSEFSLENIMGSE